MNQNFDVEFAKSYLGRFLEGYGEVMVCQRIFLEEGKKNVWFIPKSEKIAALRRDLGILGRMAANSCVFDPLPEVELDKSLYETEEEIQEEIKFEKDNQIRDSMSKLLIIFGQINRLEKRHKINFPESYLPKLWILTPTAMTSTLSGFGANTHKKWLPGIYFMPPAFHTTIVAIDELPQTPETLWLRLLGPEEMQKQAIKEVENLSTDNPLRSTALELLS
ncbi:MAG: hypothetical protein GDA56_26265 [Hormoscilla sp. GM7CHS1pb]|nr:hypothetical protein [Hormoscilla sp. GM7CHS1pb]